MHRKISIGKVSGGSIYVHRDYVDQVFPREIWEETKKCAYGPHFYSFWTIAKWNKRKETLSFIFCPTFDNQPEPEIEWFITLNLRTRKRTKKNYGRSANNIPIYHHTWLMVGDGYSKFSVTRRMIRSNEIEEVIRKHRIDRHKIGYKKYWDEVVVPLIEKERNKWNGR